MSGLSLRLSKVQEGPGEHTPPPDTLADTPPAWSCGLDVPDYYEILRLGEDRARSDTLGLFVP